MGKEDKRGITQKQFLKGAVGGAVGIELGLVSSSGVMVLALVVALTSLKRA